MITKQIFESEEDWLGFTRGLFTASRINELLAIVSRHMTDEELSAREKGDKKKTVLDESILSDGAISYIVDTIRAKRGAPAKQVYNYAMQWGKENEPQAVLKMAEYLGMSVNDFDFEYTSVGGFVFFNMNDIAGGTPDVITPQRIGEVKCPDSDTHLYYKLFVHTGNIKKELPVYYSQMQFNMYLTGREECLFMSYDPRFPNESDQSHFIHVPKDTEHINLILNKLMIAENYKRQLINKL